MPSTEEKALELIKDFGGKAHSWQIARQLSISPEYARLLLQALQKTGKIKVFHGWACLSRAKSAKALEEKPRKPKKIRKEKIKIPVIHLTPLSKVRGMSQELEKILQKAGYKETEGVAATSLPIFMESTGLELKQAADLINEARRVLKIIPDSI